MSTNASETITVTFTHPRGSGKFPVEIGRGLTGKQAIDELVKAVFIERETPNRPYVLQLQRTSSSLPLTASLMDSGVKEGDVVAIVQASEAASDAESNSPRMMTVIFLHPRGAEQFPAEIGLSLTGKEAIRELIRAGFMTEARNSSESYVLCSRRDLKALELDRPLAECGVQDGDRIAVTVLSCGSMGLSPQELRRRLALDAKVLAGLESPHLIVRGYTSNSNANAGKVASETDCDAGRACLWDVTYTFPMRKAGGETLDSVTVRFDLLAGGSYPMTPPSVQVITTPRPLSPHVHPATGIVCIGGGWVLGRTLAAQLVIQVMRILNFDEPPQSANHFCAEAQTYWRDTLKYRPLHPELVYPVLPVELTHGVKPATGGFRPIGESPAFRAVVQETPTTGNACSFSPVGRAQ